MHSCTIAEAAGYVCAELTTIFRSRVCQRYDYPWSCCLFTISGLVCFYGFPGNRPESWCHDPWRMAVLYGSKTQRPATHEALRSGWRWCHSREANAELDSRDLPCRTMEEFSAKFGR